MELVTEALVWLDETLLSTFLRESTWAFSTIEAVHVIALTLVVGMIAIVDFRLLGWASTRPAVTEIFRDVLPWTWTAFVAATVSGALMFVSHPVDYYENTAFRIKVALLLCAGANMLAFQLITYRNILSWDRNAPVPLPGKIAGAISLLCWIAVVFFGRRIGFTMSPS